ncbi:DNA polymerase I [Marinibactrum halimedae]|uniref:DNA polymerase I n=2 Tax=Marinibactrum halimedae TaxID=1444977 RepID=A0AA37WM75_9GAMM|nr:DNA polymerase I [Marinibactrum halimedae]
MLRSLIKAYPNSPIAVIFDAKGKTFRDDIYPEYKAQRPPMPDDLRLQIEPIHKIIQAMGLPMLVIDGVEADDVIGTLAARASAKGIEVVVSTGDKDMAQLVNEHVTLVNTMTNTVMNEAAVVDKFGIPPNLIIDYLALMGDKVDNIPGVAGVGEKTALALLQGLGSLEDIYNNLDKVSTLSFRGAKTMGAKLETNKDDAFLSYELATIKLDVDLPVEPEGIALEAPDQKALHELFTDMEFKSWVKELESQPQDSPSTGDADTAAAAEPIEKQYVTILEETELDSWIEKLQNAEVFAFDTETTSLNYMEARVVGVSFSVSPNEAAYVPCSHDYMGAPEQLSLEFVLNKLKPLLENPEQAKVGQNLKYDRSVLANHGITLQGIAFDTMLESYVWNSTSNRHDMDTLAETYLAASTIHFEDIAGKGAKQLTFNQIPLEQAAPYAAEDADITLSLHQTLWAQLEDEPRLQEVFNTIEMPLVPVLSDVERTGALIDANRLGAHSQELDARLTTLQKDAFDIAGEEFNLASPKQLGAILFEKLQLPVIKKTKSGAPSTAEEVLQELALDYPLPKLLLEYRSLAKLKSTYTDKLPQMINPATGRVHTSYHQAVTATGRLSSSDPNLQNIPIRTAEGRRIRQAFVAPKGYKIVAADYSQIELRIMAHLSGDEGLLSAFQNNQDVHKATAAEVFGVALEDVTNDQRRSAKAINFGLIYGMSAFGLAKQLHIGRNDAQQYIDRYFERYPGVAQYMDDIRENAAKSGYVETLFGRRLHLPEINSRNGMRRQAAERTAINAPMQGTAADIIKKAMVNVHNWLNERNLDARIIMQVHDELVLEVAEDQVDIITEELCQLMSNAAELSVPLLVEAGVGDNWDEAH